MRWRVALVLAAVFLLLTGAGAWMYFETGLKQYLRARAEIDRIAEEQTRREALEEFGWYAPGQTYGGILAGEYFGRVWVWGVKGLRSFAVDEYSVYSWYDGCSEEVLTRFNETDWETAPARLVGEIIRREVTTDVAAWRQRARVGEYVRVYLATPERGGFEGNLRDVYAYNFWLFMPWGFGLALAAGLLLVSVLSVRACTDYEVSCCPDMRDYDTGVCTMWCSTCNDSPGGCQCWAGYYCNYTGPGDDYECVPVGSPAPSGAPGGGGAGRILPIICRWTGLIPRRRVEILR